MRRTRLNALACAAAVVLLAVSGVSAEEVLHFTNGTSMVIRGHEVHDGMIHVDLGDNGFIGFPQAQVEKITEAGRDVYLPGSHLAANVAAESRSGIRVRAEGRIATGNPVSGNDTLRGSARRARSNNRGDESIEDAIAAAGASAPPPGTGLAVGLPGATNPRARALRVAGRGDAYRGNLVGNGSVSSLGRTVSGEAKLISPSYARKTGMTGNKVQRFLPSDAAASAAVAQGTTLKLPPASTPGDGSSGSSSGDSGSEQ